MSDNDYKLVPIEATDEMLEAVFEHFGCEPTEDNVLYYQCMWRRFLMGAPDKIHHPSLGIVDKPTWYMMKNREGNWERYDNPPSGGIVETTPNPANIPAREPWNPNGDYVIGKVLSEGILKTGDRVSISGFIRTEGPEYIVPVVGQETHNHRCPDCGEWFDDKVKHLCGKDVETTDDWY